MSRNVFNNETETGVGQRLLNIQNLTVAQDQVPILSTDNVVEGVNISSYGKTLLNETSVSSLRNAILQADTAVEIIDNGIGEINMEVDNNIKLQILADKSIFHNNILVDTIKRKTDDTDAISLGPTTITLQKPMTIFRDSANYGYMRIQNSINTQSGYLDWMTGSGLRVAYMGLGENNNGVTKINNSVTLGLENQCNFSINNVKTSIFKVSI